MVNLKTKSEKHAIDNEKRRKSLKEKEKARLNQSEIIKHSLALSAGSSKKIIFDENDVADEVAKNDNEKCNRKNKMVLFDDTNSVEDFEIKEKTQFEGKKGFELLNLQGTYGNDERFKLDERFLDMENDEEEEIKEKTTGNDVQNEKNHHLKILESVLGQHVVKTPENEKKTKKRTYEMIRYDAANKEHEKYEIKTDLDSINYKKKREWKKLEKLVEKELPKTEVSKEKFYEVSKEIKNSFKENGQFSLLQTYGGNNDYDETKVDDDEIDENKEEAEEFEIEEEEVNDGFEFLEKKEKNEVLIIDNNKIEEKPKSEIKVATAKGIWKEPFFFLSQDSRFKDVLPAAITAGTLSEFSKGEGLDFINKKESEEAAKVAENYDKNRRTLKEILRLHMKKQLHKKDPFKNKVGGMNKKQMANKKFRNNKNSYNKRKFPKVIIA